MVYLGGYPLGFTFKCNGVLVVAISNENTTNLLEGDIIKKIENFDAVSNRNHTDHDFVFAHRHCKAVFFSCLQCGRNSLVVVR